MVPPNHPILIGFSIINHPFGDTPIFGNTQMANGGRDGRKTTEEGHGWRDVGMVVRLFWGADQQDVVVVQSLG